MISPVCSSSGCQALSPATYHSPALSTLCLWPLSPSRALRYLVDAGGKLALMLESCKALLWSACNTPIPARQAVAGSKRQKAMQAAQGSQPEQTPRLHNVLPEGGGKRASTAPTQDLNQIEMLKHRHGINGISMYQAKGHCIPV